MDQLLEAEIPALRRYALSLCREPSEADDLVQDCLEKAISRWSSRRQEASLRAWLLTIMRNLFISGRRQRARRGWHGSLDEAEHAGVEATQEGGLQMRDIAAALAALPREQREVILLVTVEDLSYDETAQVLGVPIGTVMSRLSRARERLRRLVEGALVVSPGNVR